MVFSSIFFIFTFLPLTLILYYLSPKNFRNFIFLIASLIFYAWGEPVYIFLMIFSIIANYILGRTMHYFNINQHHKSRLFVFVMTLILNVALLGFFKYYDFFVENINILWKLDIPYKNLALPIGISFYTFQILSYIIDVYREKVEVQENLISFALYVTMFPQLVAGPIVRYSDIDAQLYERSYSFSKFGEGAGRFIQGLGKKVLLANNIGALWNTVSAMDISQASVLSVWLGIIAFTFQIYFDFSGYSDMAIGLGKMFGFDFIENFRHPYASSSITDFWRRWHISLGTWFREYIYIPLGGNRCSILKQFRNIFIVWMLTGLWHGASWNFVVWGLYYGFILFFEKLFLKEILDKLPVFFSRIYCMLIVIVGWVFFAIEDIASAKNYLFTMFGKGTNPLVDSTGIYYLTSYALLLIVMIIVSGPKFSSIFVKSDTSSGNLQKNFGIIIHIAIFIISTAYLITETYNPFLYFRF